MDIFTKRFVGISDYFLQYLNNTCSAHRLQCKIRLDINHNFDNSFGGVFFQNAITKLFKISDH